MNNYHHIIVKGRVQGVCFRANTQKQAINYNLRGYVRNLANGDVEIIVHGEASSIEKFIAWCHKGPLLAKVKQVIVNQHNDIDLLGNFEIR